MFSHLLSRVFFFFSSNTDDSDDENAINEKHARVFLFQVTGDTRFKHRSTPLKTLLGDGVVLCRLLNRAKRGTVPKINTSKSFVQLVCFSFSFPFSSSFLNHLLFFFLDRKTSRTIAKDVACLESRKCTSLRHWTCSRATT